VLDIKREPATAMETPEDRSELANIHYNLANILSHLDRHQEAEAEFVQAREILQKLTADFPKMIEFRHFLGGVLNNMAHYPIERGELAAARTLLEQAVEHQSAALKSNPKHRVYREWLGNHYRTLTEILVKQGEHAAAAKTAAEAPRLYPDKGEQCLRAAGFVARCVSLAEKDTNLADDRRRSLAQAYADQAMAWLRQAVDKGSGKAEELSKDPAFAPLRSRADFKKLLQELKERTPEPNTK
jgi:tetratricopeptide (TPR) repeat protein